MNPVKARNPALDVTRCFALLCVISIHFFLYNGYYEEVIQGNVLYGLTTLRTFFMICVPLFLLLSGYLSRSKALTSKYYSKLGRVIAIYVLASLCCGIFYAATMYLFQNEHISLWDQILGIFSFTTAPYAWYVEMYIGLFCLIPFLNILYNNLPSRREKKLLILVLLAMTALPNIINIYDFSSLQWWATPGKSSASSKLIPEFWTGIYPVTYYFIGCFLSEYPLKLSRGKCLCLIGITACAAGAINFYWSYGSGFIWGSWQDYGSALTVLQAVLVFSFLSRWNLEGLSPRAKQILAKCSDWCFGAYLVSWIFDKAMYSLLDNLEPVPLRRFCYFPLIIPIIFVCSLALSAVLNSLYSSALSRFRRMRTPTLH